MSRDQIDASRRLVLRGLAVASVLGGSGTALAPSADVLQGGGVVVGNGPATKPLPEVPITVSGGEIPRA
jgi:hypothetical protein